jgi:hypothetical protein
VQQINSIQQLQKEFYKHVLIVQKDVQHVHQQQHVKHVAQDIVYQVVYVKLLSLEN